MTRFRSIGLFTAGAAMSAALLITGTQAWQVGAAPGDSDATYQPLNPCRLIDTRVDFNVGIRKAPIGPGETYPTQVTGSNGNCVDVPVGATGVAMNVTVVNATAPSNLRVFPADLVDVPLVSNLNYSQTSPPTPNKVDSKLSPDGKIKIFNAFGNVESNIVRLEVNLTDEFRTVGQLFVTAPAAGRVYVHAQGTVVEDTAGEDVHCTLSTQTPTTSESRLWPLWEASGPNGGPDGEGDASVMSVSEVFEVDAGSSGESEFWGPRMFGVYVPD